MDEETGALTFQTLTLGTGRIGVCAGVGDEEGGGGWSTHVLAFFAGEITAVKYNRRCRDLSRVRYSIYGLGFLAH